MRNSSTLLFSTLITRIFGVKRGKDEDSKKNRYVHVDVKSFDTQRIITKDNLKIFCLLLKALWQILCHPSVSGSEDQN